MKNNIDYYRHEANSHQHPKFKMLRVKYGWEGEGKFWALNNMIAQADNCELDLSKEYVRSTIAYDLGFSLTEFDEFITYLSDKCRLIHKNTNIITTDITQETLNHLSTKRLRNKSDYEKNKAERTPSDNIKNAEIKIQTSESIQSKVKESKVKETKERYSPTSNEVRLSTLLFSLIKKRNEKHKPPNIQAWGNHVNLMIRIDNRTPKEIKDIITWCQADNFWQNNILSTEALRKQFDALILKMNYKPKPKFKDPYAILEEK